MEPPNSSQPPSGKREDEIEYVGPRTKQHRRSLPLPSEDDFEFFLFDLDGLGCLISALVTVGLAAIGALVFLLSNR